MGENDELEHWWEILIMPLVPGLCVLGVGLAIVGVFLAIKALWWLVENLLFAAW